MAGKSPAAKLDAICRTIGREFGDSERRGKKSGGGKRAVRAYCYATYSGSMVLLFGSISGLIIHSSGPAFPTLPCAMLCSPTVQACLYCRTMPSRKCVDGLSESVNEYEEYRDKNIDNRPSLGDTDHH